jgi:RHS repeat-associated protein
MLASYVQNLQVDDPLSFNKQGQTYYYHKDALGTITSLTDESGSIVQTYEYDSFGDITSQTGSIDQPFTYTGREYDAESGLYYYRARYYDARVGRFLSEDPMLSFVNSQCSDSNTISIEFRWLSPKIHNGGLNSYIYVLNNPVNSIDPVGLLACKRNPKYAVYPSKAIVYFYDCSLWWAGVENECWAECHYKCHVEIIDRRSGRTIGGYDTDVIITIKKKNCCK